MRATGLRHPGEPRPDLPTSEEPEFLHQSLLRFDRQPAIAQAGPSEGAGIGNPAQGVGGATCTDHAPPPGSSGWQAWPQMPKSARPAQRPQRPTESCAPGGYESTRCPGIVTATPLVRGGGDPRRWGRLETDKSHQMESRV